MRQLLRADAPANPQSEIDSIIRRRARKKLRKPERRFNACKYYMHPVEAIPRQHAKVGIPEFLGRLLQRRRHHNPHAAQRRRRIANRFREVAAIANLLGRFEQPVHQSPQIAARDVRAAHAVGIDSKGIGRVQAQFHLVLPLELALRHRGVEFHLSKLCRTRSRQHRQ